MASIQDLKFDICQALFWNQPHWWYLKLNGLWPEKPSALFHTGLRVDVLQKMDRKEQRSAFFFHVFCSALSSLSSSSQRRIPASAHRRAVMWFQCLGPCGRVPSGGKPLRLCWHITTPIINSRSALSFLLHLSSFLLTAPFFCFAWALISAPGSFTLNTFLLIFCLNNQTFFRTPTQHCVEWLPLSTKEVLTLLGPGQDLARKHHSKWTHIGLWRWSDWRGSDDSTHLSHTITKTLQSTRELYYHVHVGSVSSKDGSYWFPSPYFRITSLVLFYSLAFSLIFFFLSALIPVAILSDLKFFPFPISALQLICVATCYLIFI